MPTPRRIGGYEVERPLGTLPFGETLAARDEKAGPVLLVRLDAAALVQRLDPEVLLATLRRIRELDVPGVLPVLGAGRHEDDLVIVIRGTDGPTLEEVVARGPLDGQRIVRIARQIAVALEALRDAGFPHGDLRPGTVHLPGGGLAEISPPGFLPLTPDEQDIGSLAPEVLAGGPGDAASDVFSLGVVVYRALTGRSPFTGDTVEEVLAAIRSGVVEDPAKHAAAVPPGLPDLLLAMLDENPERRPTGMADRLKSIEEGRGAVRPAAPVVDVAAARAAPTAPAVAPRARVGRFRIPGARSEDALLYDVLDDVVHLGLDDGGRISLSPEPPSKAYCRVTRATLGDVLEVASDVAERPRVNGSLFDLHELREGDVVAVGGRQILYELEPPVVRPTPISSGAPTKRPARKAEATFLAVSLIVSAAVIAIAVFFYGRIQSRGREIVEKAAELEARTPELPPPESDPRAQRASDVLQEALAVKRDTPRNLDGRKALLDEILRRWPQSQASARARSELTQLESDRLDVEREILLETEVEAAKLDTAGRLGDAKRLYVELAARWVDSPNVEVAVRAAARIQKRIATRWEDDEEVVDDLVRTGDLAGAVGRLRNVLVYADERVTSRVEERLAELEQAIAAKILSGETPAPPDRPTPPDETAPPEEARPPDTPESPPEDPRSTEELRAEKIASQAWTSAKDGKWGLARELLRVLHKALSETETVQKQKEQLQALERLSILEVDGALGLTHGRVKTLDRGRIQLTYDFSDPVQAKDWRYLKPFAVKERGSFLLGPSQAHARGVGAGAYLLDLVFEGDVTMGFRIQSENPRNVGALLMDPENETRYIMFILSNTFFTLGIERTPLPGNHIILFGKGAWADTPDAELGFIRVKSATEPVLQPGQWTYMAVGRTGEQAFLSLGNKKMTGTTRGDDGKAFGDLRPTLFVLASDANFAEVVVEGRPSRDWLDNEKKTLRRILDL